ncbi:ATP-binding protein [Nitratifractor sp.]
MGDLKALYEKAGLFYLGRDVDRESFEPTDVLTLLKNKNFTTHAAIIGMTGSGKTGLGIGIIEEAAIDNIPSIVIDPKGDMGDLLLTDPEFRPQSFLPWVRDEAEAKGVDPMEYAAKTAKTWKEGIESWGQDSERVARFQKVPKTIYTPGSRAGIPINLMSSLQAPPSEILEDADDFASYLRSTVSGLLALLDIEADPMESKEYLLLAQILSKSWTSGEELGIESLVGRILHPPFKKVGVLPLESFYPEKERFKLATRFNAVMASPDFVNWLSGEGLDIPKLLYDSEGKAKIAIFSIAHLGDAQRMFFVTLLLNKYIAWMRRQSGSSRLRTLLYMDEIYGFFPPVKNPSSKEPMITLLKQARAYGIGIVLSTQNPVDLDYKGLSNIGTWFIGRLQTTQDIERVIDGLGGKVGSSFDRKEIARLLSNLQKRVFFLKSAHLDELHLFGTRWVMSYLKGPLKKEEITRLMASRKEDEEPTETLPRKTEDGWGEPPVLGSGVPQYFELDPSGRNRYRPFLAARCSLEFRDARRGIEEEREENWWLDLEGIERPDWDRAERDDETFDRWPAKAPDGALCRPLPSFVTDERGLKASAAALKNWLYQEERLTLYRVRSLKLESKPGESEEDFLVRVRDRIEELKEEAIEELKERYAKKEERLQDQLRRAMERVQKEKTDQTSSLISVGASILGALFGGRGLSASKIGTAINRSGRVLKERGDLSRAEQKVEEVREKIEALEEKLEEEIDEIDEKYRLENYKVESFSIRPRKSDIRIERIAIVWRPEL